MVFTETSLEDSRNSTDHRVRSQIQDRILEHERSDNHLPMQERTNAKFRIHPRHHDDITGRKERGIFYTKLSM